MSLADPSKSQQSTQVTKRQHFVPQFYLRWFANSLGAVEVLDLKRREILKPRSPKAVCYEWFFYAVATGVSDEVSQQLEANFRELEDGVAKQLEPIITKLLSQEQIDEEEKWVVAFLMSMLWIRGPAMREQINDMSEKLMKHMNTMRFSHPSADSLFDEFEKETGEALSPKVRERIKTQYKEGNYTLEFNNVTHLRMFKEFNGFANLFCAQDWIVYVSRSAKKFTTTDNPITVVIPERKSFYGPTFLERTHYFPLTPDILIMGRFPIKDYGKKLHRKTFFPNDDREILKLNLITSNQALEFGYARDRQSFEDILTTVKTLEKLQASMGQGSEKTLLGQLNADKKDPK